MRKGTREKVKHSKRWSEWARDEQRQKGGTPPTGFASL